MIEQRTPEWFAARCGRVTASRVADVVARTKTGWGASRANYMAQLIAERLTGVAAEGYTNAEMRWGTDHEADALTAYAFMRDADVTPAGFIDHPTVEMSGASPDGFVGDDGLVEVKCPNTATHIDTLLGQSIPSKYADQMLWQMACAGRAWCDFVSYDPRLPEPMRTYVRRLRRNDERIAELEHEVRIFLRELDAKVDDLTKVYMPPEDAPWGRDVSGRPMNLLAAL